MRRKSTHEVGNVYAKAIPGIPRHRWQEWRLVKIIESDCEPPHARLQEIGGKTVRTLACTVLDDDAVWNRCERIPQATDAVAN
jgi:hypothetical protein